MKGFIRNIGQVSGTAFPSDLMEFEQCWVFFVKKKKKKFQYKNIVLVATHSLTVLNINISPNGWLFAESILILSWYSYCSHRKKFVINKQKL